MVQRDLGSVLQRLAGRRKGYVKLLFGFPNLTSRLQRLGEAGVVPRVRRVDPNGFSKYVDSLHPFALTLEGMGRFGSCGAGDEIVANGLLGPGPLLERLGQNLGEPRIGRMTPLRRPQHGLGGDRVARVEETRARSAEVTGGNSTARVDRARSCRAARRSWVRGSSNAVRSRPR